MVQNSNSAAGQRHIINIGLPAVQIAGHKTGFGSPSWLETHPTADVTAPTVAALLEAGAVVRVWQHCIAMRSMHSLWHGMSQHAQHSTAQRSAK
jgi:hypothetical protein